MYLGTHKLVRVKNHYHILGEKCHHSGRAPKRKAKKAPVLAIGLILWSVLAFSSLPFLSTTVSYAAESKETTKVEPIVEKPETVNEKIVRYAKKHKISPTKLEMIVRLESQYNEKAVGDMDIICKRTGKPVRARGAVQITECFHPEVSDEEAFDWDFSLNWAAEKIAAKQCGKEWTTCRF